MQSKSGTRAVHQRHGNAIVKLALSVLLRLRQQIWRGTRLRVDLPTRTRRAFDYLRLQDAKQECGGVRKEGSFQRVESCFRRVQLAEEDERGESVRAGSTTDGLQARDNSVCLACLKNLKSEGFT